MQKELGRYLLPVSRKKYKTVRHLKKYPPKGKALASRPRNNENSLVLNRSLKILNISAPYPY